MRLNSSSMKILASIFSNHAKAIPAVLGALVFVGLAFLPALFGEYGQPTLDEKGKIKVEKPKNGSSEEMKDKDKKEEGLEIKSLFVAADGGLYIGGKHSFHVLQGGDLQEISSFPGRDIKGVAGGPDGMILVASKSGLHQYQGEKWSQLHEAEGEAVAVAEGGTIFFAPKKMGLLQSTDGGKTWQAVELPGIVLEMKDSEKKSSDKKEE
jgi:hypothetical protein